MPDLGDIDFSGSSAGQDSGLANPFLNAVAPEDRDVVAKYIQDWDKGVSQRFNQIHQQYEPYKQLEKQYGSMDQVSAALEVYELLDSNPKYVYDELGKLLGLTGKQVEKALEDTESQGNQIPKELQGYLTPLQQQLEKQQQILEALAQQTVQTTTSQREAQEDAVLDSVMEQLHDDYGDFDEQYVLLMMHNDMEPAEAVEAWQEMIENYSGGNNNQQRFAPLPPALSGGQVPGSQQSVAEMDRKGVQNLVANLMAGIQNNHG